MTPRYRDHHERVAAQLAQAKTKAELAETAWLILAAGPIDGEERRQAKKAIRSAQNLTRQIVSDRIIATETKQEMAAVHARLTWMVEEIKHVPRKKAA